MRKESGAIELWDLAAEGGTEYWVYKRISIGVFYRPNSRGVMYKHCGATREEIVRFCEGKCSNDQIDGALEELNREMLIYKPDPNVEFWEVL